MQGMTCHLFRLERALYGHTHTHSGVFRQRYCHKQCLKAGFELLSENWPGVYWNPDSKLMLDVYVDDMKLAGPTHEMEKAWIDLQGDKNIGGITLENPKGDTQDTMTFLGYESKHSTEIFVHM